ncbi:Mth938-like domain-containing protein [Roseateles sp. So40a]|uniref:Mth938-like domain-containing protein n=1 Tax=Roseateles sp. So40a TaxID=3400226 RepID=UPI003A83BFB0
MKFQPDQPLGGNMISAHDLHHVWVNGVEQAHSVLVPWQGQPEAWNVRRFEDLTEAHFERILALKPELVIFGSGSKIRFARPALYRGLIQARIGMETMDIGAACRTYNVLASEGRAVLAALLIEA